MYIVLGSKAILTITWAQASQLEWGGNIWGKKCHPPWLGVEENFSLFTPSKHPKTLFNWGEEFTR